MTTVLVAVPAHDEAQEVGACLAHLRAAVVAALAVPSPPSVRVAVSAHRCRDDTEARAVEALGDFPVPHLVTRDERRVGVGGVRRRLVDLVRTGLQAPGEDTWLLNTDADSYVPPDWIVETLRLVGPGRPLGAGAAAPVAVAGMVELRGWAPSQLLRERYARLVAAQRDAGGHTHVYGANLAVRLDAYDRVGGFRAVHGEDQDLVDRLRAGGEVVVSSVEPVVSTSARSPGRAEHGLGALLARLDRLDRLDRPDLGEPVPGAVLGGEPLLP